MYEDSNERDRQYCYPYGYKSEDIEFGHLDNQTGTDKTERMNICGGANTWLRTPRHLSWYTNEMSDNFQLKRKSFELKELRSPRCLEQLAQSGSFFCPGGFYCPGTYVY